MDREWGRGLKLAELKAVHPVLNVRDVSASAQWYGSNLGFVALFADAGDDPKYGGIGRDGVEIHLQWHSIEEWSDGLQGSAYRFLVDDPDVLFAEFAMRTPGILERKTVSDTEWGTREFGLYDPDGNALFFYKNR